MVAPESWKFTLVGAVAIAVGVRRRTAAKRRMSFVRKMVSPVGLETVEFAPFLLGGVAGKVQTFEFLDSASFFLAHSYSPETSQDASPVCHVAAYVSPGCKRIAKVKPAVKTAPLIEGTAVPSIVIVVVSPAVSVAV
ncbi:MAG: hypothetical protein KGI38_12100 [Thaumarchaeota archaeon]|nr:hypothetical protein [Nitrososphaerota archaeon]